MDLLLLGLVWTMLTVLTHSLGTSLAITYYLRLWEMRKRRRWVRIEVVMILLVTCLLLTHLVEVGLWALVYLQGEMLPDLATATYFSFTSYTTVGDGDVVLPEDWRLLGPTEAVMGVLMMGWSTAILVTVLQKTYQTAFSAIAGKTHSK